MANFQRQECFILANNFVGDDPTYGNVYLSKMIVPFMQVIEHKIEQDIEVHAHKDEEPENMNPEPLSKLKYIVWNLHDTNLSNLLRFLGYWDKYGYKKHVKYASSIRLEIFRANIQGKPYQMEDYKVRFVYDDEEIKLPICN